MFTVTVRVRVFHYDYTVISTVAMEVGLALPLTPPPTAQKAVTVHVARRGTRFCEGHRGSEEKTPHKNTQRGVWHAPWRAGGRERARGQWMDKNAGLANAPTFGPLHSGSHKDSPALPRATGELGRNHHLDTDKDSAQQGGSVGKLHNRHGHKTRCALAGLDHHLGGWRCCSRLP